MLRVPYGLAAVFTLFFSDAGELPDAEFLLATEGSAVEGREVEEDEGEDPFAETEDVLAFLSCKRR